MLIPYQTAADYLEITVNNLTGNARYSKFLKESKFDITMYQADLKVNEERKDYCFDVLNFSDFVIEKIGMSAFYNSFKGKDRANLRDAVSKCRISFRLATVVENMFKQEWRALYENDEMEEKINYVSFVERKPLTKSFLMVEYWHKKKSPVEIAKSLNVPNTWVYSEIRRLELQKGKNGIKRKGRKGFVMSKEQRKKHENQPHAKPVVQICPKSFNVVKEYGSTGAVERYGFSRANIRKAIKSAGISKGFLWAYKGMEKPTVDHAKKKGNLNSKLQAAAYKKPTKNQLKSLYIDANMTLNECAKHFKCHRGTMAILAMDYGLKKRTEKISISTLKRLYVQKGVSVEKIAETYGYTVSTVRTYLSKNGLTRKEVA